MNAYQFDKTGTGDAAASNLSHRYLWGTAVDQILADEKVTSLGTAGTVTWPLTDNLGTARDLAQYNSGNDTTTIANHRVFDAYGKLVSQTNQAVDCVFGFTGRMFDKDTGLQNNVNRWYDPSVGRWMSEDPIGSEGGVNLTAYAGNGPVNYSDPYGLSPWPGIGKILGKKWGALLASAPLKGLQRNCWPHSRACAQIRQRLRRLSVR